MPDDLNRREFARVVTTGLTAAAGFAGTEALATADEEPKKPVPLPVLVLARITEEFPSDHYDDAAMEGILSDIRGDLARGRELSKFALKNSDEPAFIFPGDYRSRIHRPQPEGR